MLIGENLTLCTLSSVVICKQIAEKSDEKVGAKRLRNSAVLLETSWDWEDQNWISVYTKEERYWEIPQAPN